MLSDYLADLIILLLAAVILVPVAQIFRMGAVPGFLLAGIAVGPSGLSLINKSSEIAHFAEIGVVLLLFVIGIELKPAQLRRMRRLVFGLGSVQLIATGLVLTLVVHFVFDINVRAAVLIGPALALSSTAFVVQLIAERRLLLTKYGRASIGVLLLQDLAVVPLLALVPMLAMPDMSISSDIGLALLQSIVVLAVVIVAGRFLLHPLLHRVAMAGNSDIFTASAVLIVLGTAFITEHIGLSMAMGAFIAGMLISDSYYRHQVLAEIQPFRGLLLGLFFMSMGMSFDISLLLQHPSTTIALVAGLVLIKVGLLFPLTLMFGLGRINGLAVSLVLGQSGEFALVLFSLASQAQIIEGVLFQQLLLVVLMSMLITPILANWAHNLVYKESGAPVEDEPLSSHAPVVIVGFGRFGQHMGEILSAVEKPYVALDTNANIVAQKRTQGFPVYFGDACRAEVLQAAGASQAELIIVTVNDAEATELLVAELRQKYPDKKLFARGHNQEHCRKLYRLGAQVVSENIEASVQLAQKALLDLGVDNNRLEGVLEAYQRSYYQHIKAAKKARD